MKILDDKKSKTPNKVISENEKDGHIICSCSHEFKYDFTKSLNTGSWFGYRVPICPKCEAIPSSDTRRMDL